jgi:hypothetical protein
MARGLALLSKAFGARLARLNSAQQSELATLREKLLRGTDANTLCATDD